MCPRQISKWHVARDLVIGLAAHEWLKLLFNNFCAPLLLHLFVLSAVRAFDAKMMASGIKAVNHFFELSGLNQIGKKSVLFSNELKVSAYSFSSYQSNELSGKSFCKD